ncbi:hypothetical protein KDK95_16545 [Actinospica sp. MGRD01-02]|uniref:Guanylate cyclase domain-containing protein n=1 Tax=Actinospica acidithermotolerans TaxID=2828514 RepID=A0A941ECH7_9ACTN|nr:hypothetical protein [Actinospica acidithermotolerans]MBR7827928.1 hypothetical protein [Actinospica acidithermotolerans]
MAAEDATHHSIMALDIEGFTQRDNPAQISLHDAVYGIVGAAASDVGIDLDQIGQADTGDGMLLFFPASVPTALLVGPLVRALGDRLAERAKQSSAQYTPRLRIALHHGLAHRGERGWTGDAVNFTCRLVDAQPLREVLAAASRTNLVLIASDQVYEAVIRHDYRAADPATYRAVTFSVKQLKNIRAWIYAPGYPNPPGLPSEPLGPAAADAGADEADVDAGEVGARLGAAAETVVRNQPQADTVEGNQIGEMHVTIHNPGSVRL